MEIVRIILTVIFIAVCIALTVLVLMQEGKAAGLGSIAGGAETYWGKNKGRSMEGLLVKITRWLAVGFMLIAVILNISRLWD
ncbi:MAG: preprotein translocase subunit SecG [Eubacteriales bacterium]|nr:preprotein translocase subunit SecG [Eubacteriales bacterium]